jgi:hypothetical protein
MNPCPRCKKRECILLSTHILRDGRKLSQIICSGTLGGCGMRTEEYNTFDEAIDAWDKLWEEQAEEDQ